MKRSPQLFDGGNTYVETCVCIARLSEAESVYRSSQAEASCSEVFFILQRYACATNYSSHGNMSDESGKEENEQKCRQTIMHDDIIINRRSNFILSLFLGLKPQCFHADVGSLGGSRTEPERPRPIT